VGPGKKTGCDKEKSEGKAAASCLFGALFLKSAVLSLFPLFFLFLFLFSFFFFSPLSQLSLPPSSLFPVVVCSKKREKGGGGGRGER